MTACSIKVEHTRAWQQTRAEAALARDNQERECSFPFPCVQTQTQTNKTSRSRSTSRSSSKSRARLEDDVVPDFVKPLSNKVGEDDKDYLIAKGVFQLPTAEFQSIILQRYAEHVRPLLPLLDLSEVLDTVSAAGGQRDNNEMQVSLLLYWSILCAGLAATERQVILKYGYGSKAEARYSFYKKAKVLFDLETELDRIVLCQSAVLLVSWSQDDHRIDLVHWIGVAISQAYSLKLHREEHNARSGTSARAGAEITLHKSAASESETDLHAAGTAAREITSICRALLGSGMEQHVPTVGVVAVLAAFSVHLRCSRSERDSERSSAIEEPKTCVRFVNGLRDLNYAAQNVSRMIEDATREVELRLRITLSAAAMLRIDPCPKRSGHVSIVSIPRGDQADTASYALLPPLEQGDGDGDQDPALPGNMFHLDHDDIEQIAHVTVRTADFYDPEENLVGDDGTWGPAFYVSPVEMELDALFETFGVEVAQQEQDLRMADPARG
ncbi:hypothetical protein AYO20_02811 [Fonsecaea nubica]|uniref:Xylanolytic transcriptional activator regulatory domain-containing protein n=1 Tax=Fonsecaea nubica TaxID=856822 RepID=A0A178D7B1_9EURO|nr:hypothetical protein AYO20_02811 [Fonsecaea nubica]OAL37978.1 hypothetical protein AYO20_02811 [Fonsecaea nubica]